MDGSNSMIYERSEHPNICHYPLMPVLAGQHVSTRPASDHTFQLGTALPLRFGDNFVRHERRRNMNPNPVFTWTIFEKISIPGLEA